jgi:hypothetical protein
LSDAQLASIQWRYEFDFAKNSAVTVAESEIIGGTSMGIIEGRRLAVKMKKFADWHHGGPRTS